MKQKLLFKEFLRFGNYSITILFMTLIPLIFFVNKAKVKESVIPLKLCYPAELDGYEKVLQEVKFIVRDSNYKCTGPDGFDFIILKPNEIIIFNQTYSQKFYNFFSQEFQNYLIGIAKSDLKNHKMVIIYTDTEINYQDFITVLDLFKKLPCEGIKFLPMNFMNNNKDKI